MLVDRKWQQNIGGGSSGFEPLCETFFAKCKVEIMRKVILVAALSAPLIASAAPNLITNGDFENYSWASSSSLAETVFGGPSNAIVGWTVGGTSVDVIRNSVLYGSISGNSIDMFGTPGPGSLSQSFSTVIGQQYSIQFDLSYNDGGGNFNLQPDMFSVYVSLNGGAATNFVGTRPSATHYSESFTATTGLTTLKFASPASYVDSSGATLDNVSVTAVPEPETYAMLIAGLGLMGAVAVRRKSKHA
jgi:choice-of-anchor C domain-containing protein